MKLLDVEDLLIWVAAELARKPPETGRAARQAFDVSRADRELVGRWDRPMGFPAVSPMFSPGISRGGRGRGEPPHPDALRVESALEALRLTSPPCVIDEPDIAHDLGFRLDVAGELRAALRNAANLVIVHGRLASRPMLRLKPLEASPRLASNGKPGVWRREEWLEPTFADHAQTSRFVEVRVVAIRKNLYPTGAYGVVDWSPSPGDVLAERAEYAAWLSGLVWIAQSVSGALESRAALPPRAAARPWMGERDGEPIRDVTGPGADRVYSAADAAGLAGERRAGRRRPRAGGATYAFAPARRGEGEREA
jgi:hypothetical protein